MEIFFLLAFSGVGGEDLFSLGECVTFFVLSAGLCFDLVLLGFWRVSKNGILVLLGMF